MIVRTKAKLITILAAVVLVVLFFGAPPAKAASCNNLSGESRQICEASFTSCTNKDDDKAKACRYGFREAYKDLGKKMADICKRYSGDKKQSCESGVRDGRTYKRESEKKVTFGNSGNADQCGSGSGAVKTKFNFGCLGDDYKGPGGAIGDLAFAIIRFLSFGVGIFVVVAIIASGIQYTTSEGNPEATQAAKSRIQASIISLIIYIFAFAIIQFLVPGGVF